MYLPVRLHMTLSIGDMFQQEIDFLFFVLSFYSSLQATGISAIAFLSA